MNALVIGGRGHFGSEVVRALRTAGHRVESAGRRVGGPGVRVDLNAPDTFAAMDAFEVVVNASDSLTAPPDQAIEHCLAQGKTFVECSADAETVERLIHAHRGPSATRGRLLLGAGLFPGVSNVLAASALPSDAAANTVELAAQSSPFAGGGRGMCRLMVTALAHNAVTFAQNQRTEYAPASPGPRLRFGGEERRTMRVDFAETAMLHASTGALNVATYFSPAPALLITPMTVLARSSLLKLGFVRWAMLVSLILLRAWLLRRLPTAVALSAVVDRVGSRRAQGVFRTVRVNDGVLAGACATTALIEAIVARPDQLGLVLPDQVITLEPLLQRMQNHGAGRLQIEHSLEPAALPSDARTAPGELSRV